MRQQFCMAAVALCAGGLLLALAGPSLATVRMQERAKQLGYPADDCAYCHSFTREHMTRNARKAGLQSTNCIYCHGTALPLDGVDLYNERGRFLLKEKKARKAKHADMRWLEGYAEKDEPRAGASPAPDKPERK